MAGQAMTGAQTGAKRRPDSSLEARRPSRRDLAVALAASGPLERGQKQQAREDWIM